MTAATARWTYQMLANETLWKVATEVHHSLALAELPHAIVGGVAVCLHGYRRNTVDVDLLIRPADSQAIGSVLEAKGFLWNDIDKEFHSPCKIPVPFVNSGEREGKGQETLFPDPADSRSVVTIEELPVLSLAQLIQSKIACGLGNPRRTHKDFADVVELIACNRLDSSFARHLHNSVRKEFRVLRRHAAGESGG